MKYIFTFYIIIFSLLIVGCEGPAGQQGPRGDNGISTVWIQGSISANTTYNPYGTSSISVYNTLTIPSVMLDSIPYNYDGNFNLDFEPLNPNEYVHITVDGINLDGDSIHSYSDLIVPGPIDLYNESSNDTIYITLGDDARFIWNSADNSVRYKFLLYIYYYYSDTSGLYQSYSFSIDTMLIDTSLIIPTDSICPNINEISDIINTSGYCWISASNGPLYMGDTNNVYGDGAGFISIKYYSKQYSVSVELESKGK